MSGRLARMSRNIINRDRDRVWHPFTQMKEWRETTPVIISEGRGCYLKDVTGRWYLDGVSSLWVNVHGHRNKEIDEAISSQIDRISHSTLLGLTHPLAGELAEMLVKIAPPGLSKVFYSDNGSTATEIGLKMAYQYWQFKGKKEKTAFVCLNNAYHGDTIGAVSVGGIDLFHDTFRPLLFRTFRAPSPYCYRCELGKSYPSCRLACLRELERIIKKNHRKIAAMIIEPLVQGAGGMIVSPPGYLRGVRRLCTTHKVLMIADEVATGFGRTGKMFACEHEKVSPEILCVAKGMTGGYLPLAATLTRENIYRAFLGRYEDMKTFFHGHTYTGNQLGCAAAKANLGIFGKERTLVRMRAKMKVLQRELEKIAALDHVGEVRHKGFMVGIELVRNRKSKEPFPVKERRAWKVCARARQKGLIIRPLGDVVVLMPPLSISSEELKSLTRITAEAIEHVTG